MALENKKLKNNKNLVLENQTIEDKQDANKNDTMTKAIISGLAIAGGIALYKSGALKGIAHGLKEFGAAFAESSADGYHSSRAMKNWAEGKTGELLRPNRSLFNDKKSASAGYDLWQDLKTSFSRGELYTANTRRIINDTITDLNILTNMIQEETKGWSKASIETIRKEVHKEMDGAAQEAIDAEIAKRVGILKQEGKELIKKRNASIKNARLFKNINSINNTVRTMDRNGLTASRDLATADIMRDFVENMTLTESRARSQLRQTGYRTLTLGDIFETYDLDTHELKFKDGFSIEKLYNDYGIDLNETIGKNDKTVMSTINSLLEGMDPKTKLIYQPEEGILPKPLGAFEDVWKNLIIDERLNVSVNKKGEIDNIINYMMGEDALKFFGNSLRKDFKLPVLGFNPIDSAIKVTPLDKILNDRSVSYGLINGVKNYNPYITGFGGRQGDDINTALQKRFNKPDETFHVLFSNGKAYALGDAGTKEFLGDGFKLYDITGADKAFKLPHSIESMRIMGGYDLNRDPMHDVLEEIGHDMSKPFDPHMTIQEYEAINNIKLTKAQKLKYEIGRHLDLGYQEFREPHDNGFVDIGQRTNIDNFFDDLINDITHSNFLRTNGFQFENYEEAASAIRDKTYEMAFGKGFEDFIDKQGNKIHPKTFVMSKEGVGIKNLIKDAKNNNNEQFVEDVKTMFGQYFSGFSEDKKIGKYFTESTTRIYDIFNALDSGLASIGLGLSLESKRSVGSLVGNLLVKRALPVYMLTQIPGMINYFSEPIFTNKEEKESGNNDNLGKTLMRNVVKPIDIKAHKVGDRLGFTKMFKYLQEMTPGYEHFNELPIIYQLGLGQTEEERKEYIEKGYDPIRKNRYWSVSNTPFTGSKIDHWRPNIYRRVEADTKFSSTKYGSRQEYYNNTWYPNLINPFAPINHFILDPHHWDKKHYNDRPYAETAPKGENIPLIGPLVSGTIGQVYRKKMHKEYWNEDGTLKPVNYQDEKPSQLLSTGTSTNIINKKSFMNDIWKTVERAFVDTETFNKINANAEEQYVKAKRQHITDILFAQKVIDSGTPQFSEGKTFSQYKYEQSQKQSQAPIYDNALLSYTVAYNPNTPGKLDIVRNFPYSDGTNIDTQLFTKAKEYASPLQTSVLPYRDYNRYDTALDVYTTPSGQVQIVDVPENLNLYKVNEEIKHYSLNKIYGTNQRVNVKEYDEGYQQQELPDVSNSLMYAIGQEFNDLSNIYGLKGFLTQAMFTGEANVGATKVENSSYTYSANRSFWDANLGGLGGELSEISRRFIHKKDKDVEYLNPIRNTMPTWLPGSNYFTDFLHGDPYSKVMNGEERLPGEAYERLNNIGFTFSTSASMLASSRSAHVKHFLHQDTNLTYEDEQAIKQMKKDPFPGSIIEDQYEIQNLNTVEEFITKVIDHFRDSDVLIDHKIKVQDKEHDITGVVDARIKDFHSRTGESLINIRGVDSDQFKRLQQGHDIRKQDYYEMNFDMWALDNTKGRGYIYYYDKDNPDDIYKARMKFSQKDLRSSIQNLNDAKTDIYKGLQTGEISRGDLYSLVDKYKILADVAPYSQEFKDISAQIANGHLTAAEKREIKAARDRMKEQKEPLRTYDYKFKTANLKSEKVTVKDVIDNNTIIVEEYGKEHAIKFAGINVSESNSTLYAPTVKEKKEINKRTGRERTIRKGKTMNEAANDEIMKYLKPGRKITIQYDADERNKYNKDSTQSIRAVVNVKGVNLNRKLLNKGLAKEKENDDSAAGINARYSKGDIAFGSMMESLTHGASKLPFVGDKFFQIRSPYEQYRKREVYNKDFKSWNHPIRDYLIPTIEDSSSQHPIAGIVGGAFLGSLFGKGPYGKMLGTIIGGTIPAIGQVVHAVGSTKDSEWRPKRRRQQEEMNVYLDTLKYVKNTRLYNQYKELAKKKDHFDVDKYLEKQEKHGEENKERAKELNNYKRLVKLDFKHRGNYNFKYGEPKYVEKGQSKKETITAINRELAEISSDRKVEKLPLNAIKAISYKQAADKTVYGFKPGDDIRNIMSALPKKERQYYSKLVEAPEEEKEKILRIAPSYLKKALQASWGMHVDEQPELTEYFKNHALPDENWEGWQEEVDLDDVKVKMINANGLDPGEFDIWTDNKKKADQTNIPIPKIRARNINPNAVESQLRRILGNAGFNNVQVSYMNGINDNQTTFNILEDPRLEVDNQIKNLQI